MSGRTRIPRGACSAPIYCAQLFFHPLADVHAATRRPADRAPLAAADRAGERGARSAGGGRRRRAQSSPWDRRRSCGRDLQHANSCCASQHALLPGFVNAHTRACHALLRGLPVRGPRLRWLAETVTAARAARGERGLRARRHAPRRRGDAARRHHLLRGPEPPSRGSGPRRRRRADARAHRAAGQRCAERLGRGRDGALGEGGKPVGRVPQ